MSAPQTEILTVPLLSSGHCCKRKQALLLTSSAFPTEPCRANPSVKKSKGPAGAHVVGHLDTYHSLEQHILEGKALAHELICLTRPALGLSSTGKEVQGGQGGLGACSKQGSAIYSICSMAAGIPGCYQVQVLVWVI